ncbi:acetoacetyl-CoA reductase [Paraburkholderia youngii]
MVRSYLATPAIGPRAYTMAGAGSFQSEHANVAALPYRRIKPSVGMVPRGECQEPKLSGQFSKSTQSPAADGLAHKGNIMSAKRVAFVTGGMGGLGAAISRRLHDTGMVVALSHSERNNHVATWLVHERDVGRRFVAFEVDVSSFDSCARCAERVLTEFGMVDILVNNAGITRDSSFARMTKEDWDKVLRTNLDSMFNMTKPFLGGMVKQGFGRIVNIGSVNGARGAFGQTNYAAAKAGIHGFTMSLALETARYGVTVNTVSPGYLATTMTAAIPKDVMETRILPQIPVGRLGQPDEVAAVVAFLCSDEAGFVTGTDFSVNGGMHMR